MKRSKTFYVQIKIFKYAIERIVHINANNITRGVVLMAFGIVVRDLTISQVDNRN
jgi:hypothetical protein